MRQRRTIRAAVVSIRFYDLVSSVVSAFVTTGCDQASWCVTCCNIMELIDMYTLALPTLLAEL